MRTNKRYSRRISVHQGLTAALNYLVGENALWVMLFGSGGDLQMYSSRKKC